MAVDEPSTINSPVADYTERAVPAQRVVYPALDGLRGVAFLAVFGLHFLYLPWGWAGVDIFFVLSGFLITGMLFDTRDDPHRIRNFYIRRALRIFPLYYTVLAAIFFCTPFAHWHWYPSWLLLPAYVANFKVFTGNTGGLSDFDLIGQFSDSGWLSHPFRLHFGHLWSLCVEEQFYLVWPWIVFWIRDRRRLMTIAAATIPICLSMRIAVQAVVSDPGVQAQVLYHFTPFRIDSLLIGALIALLMRGSRQQTMLRVARFGFPVALAAMLVLIVRASGTVLWLLPFNAQPNWALTWGFSMIDIVAGLGLIVAIQPATLVFRVLNIRPLRWVGRLSYGAYVLLALFRDECGFVAASILKHWHQWRDGAPSNPIELTLLAAFISLAFTLSLAWLSFRFLESPFLKLKDRWTVRNCA
jgi:peptidoglycan/LPS O-acetylase OafA/YrhL